MRSLRGPRLITVNRYARARIWLSSLLDGCRGAFYPFIKPTNHFSERMFNRLTRCIRVTLIGQLDVPDYPSISLDRFIHSFTLNREGAWIIVSHAVNEKKGPPEFVRVHKRRQFHVHIWGLPEGPALILKSKRDKCTIECAIEGHSGAEQIRMYEEIGGHKCTITVPRHANATRVRHPHFYGLVDGSSGTGHDLFQVSVVGFLRIPDNRHGSVVQHSITVQEQKQW